MTRRRCDLLDTKGQRRAIIVRLDDKQFKGLKEIAEKENLTLGQMVKKDLLVRLEIKMEMRERVSKVIEMIKNPTPREPPQQTSNDCE